MRLELQGYGDQLGRTIERALEAAEPGIEAAAIEQAPLPKEERNALKDVAVTAAALALIPRVKVNEKTLARLFGADQTGQASPMAKSLFRAVDKAVRKGIIDDKPTDEIATSIAKRTKRSGLDRINLTAPSVARQLRGQATALSRTAMGAYNQEVKERLTGKPRPNPSCVTWSGSMSLCWIQSPVALACFWMARHGSKVIQVGRN